ncbi:hypothetical protein KC19_11G042600 [Ceratodon purpureus]|uniref:Secreted protein n=1 Tax=Ceratodon purpureus TaxID=3225 RepID=A0A8T0GCR9_CERPU|nr:hypothetical protein KC19_11G042600 [Ceratodon purpureus]
MFALVLTFLFITAHQMQRDYYSDVCCHCLSETPRLHTWFSAIASFSLQVALAGDDEKDLSVGTRIVWGGLYVVECKFHLCRKKLNE